MSDYDFKTLNDKEFEIFCSDLLSSYIGVRFERFKAGRDGGVDGRYFTSTGREVILQCKHWARTPIPQLISSLKNIEKPKLDALKPSRYILAISNNLSRADKKSIADALQPHVLSESDVFGCEDLNDLLSRNETVERRHYKLWMRSSQVLLNFMNNAIIGRSRDEIDTMRERAAFYVKTSNHEAAYNQLERMHAVIVTGEPGIGKTTLADQICLDYVARGFGFVKVGDDISEAENVFDSESKQIFYFDDFLGRNYLEALNGHEGGKITNFIKRISRNTNKRFILTSRSTILNQGKLLIDLFQHNNTQRNEYELNIRKLSQMDRALILYNHIWFSELTSDYIDVLYKDARYLSIIRHSNFNPRLISYITDSQRLQHVPAAEYWVYVERSLANPAQVWEHPFEAQQDDFSRAIMLLVVMNGRQIDEPTLSDAYYSFITMSINQNMHGRQDFQLNIRSLTGSFLNRYVSQKNPPQFDLFNPSIGDYVLRRYASNIPSLKAAFACLRTQTSLVTFFSLFENGTIRASDAQDMAQEIFKSAIKKDLNNAPTNYLLTLFSYIVRKWTIGASLSAIMAPICDHIWTNSDQIPISEELLLLIQWGQKNHQISDDAVANFLGNNFDSITTDSEISECWKLLHELNLRSERKDGLVKVFVTSIEEMISDNLTDFIEVSDAFNNCDYGEYNDAREKLAELLNDKLNDLGIPQSYIDSKELIESFDVEDHMDNYFRNSYEPEYDRDDRAGPSLPSSDNAIHDLFDRG